MGRVLPARQMSCEDVEKSLRGYRVLIKSTLSTLRTSGFIALHALWSKLPASHQLLRPTKAHTAEQIPDPPIQC
jgi:hypothetical protein